LRLQHLNQLDLETLQHYASRANSPKLNRAVEVIANLASAEAIEYEPLS
jgi:hypothetical protein